MRSIRKGPITCQYRHYWRTERNINVYDPMCVQPNPCVCPLPYPPIHCVFHHQWLSNFHAYPIPCSPAISRKRKNVIYRSIIVLAYPLITFSRCTLCALNAFRNAFTMDRKCESYWAERKTTSEHRYSQCGEPSSLTRSSAIPPRPLPPPLCSSTTIRASLLFRCPLAVALCKGHLMFLYL